LLVGDNRLRSASGDAGIKAPAGWIVIPTGEECAHAIGEMARALDARNSMSMLMG